MTERSLQVTYRKGRAFAAYLHLSHPTGEKSTKVRLSHCRMSVGWHARVSDARSLSVFRRTALKVARAPSIEPTIAAGSVPDRIEMPSARPDKHPSAVTCTTA